jgi:uncharacterized membrane protein YbaN (DUF454 family)
MPLKMIGKPVLFALGWISVLLGVIGAFLPVLPTTPFMILAAYLFNKSSPRVHSWLTSTPYFGDAIIDWERNKVIRPKAKRMATIMIVLLMGSTIIFAKIHWGLKVMLAVIGASVITFILTRRSHAPEGRKTDSRSESNHETTQNTSITNPSA